MKYLITGGAGFIGIKLTEELLKNKKNIIYIIDNFSKNTGSKNCRNIIKNKNVKIIKKNLNDIESYLKIYNFDYIYHFAALLGVKSYRQSFCNIKRKYYFFYKFDKFFKETKKLKKFVLHQLVKFIHIV